MNHYFSGTEPTPAYRAACGNHRDNAHHREARRREDAGADAPARADRPAGHPRTDRSRDPGGVRRQGDLGRRPDAARARRDPVSPASSHGRAIERPSGRPRRDHARLVVACADRLLAVSAGAGGLFRPVDSRARARRSAAPGPAAPPARGDMGSGWGSTITITQDAKQLVVESVIYSPLRSAATAAIRLCARRLRVAQHA